MKKRRKSPRNSEDDHLAPHGGQTLVPTGTTQTRALMAVIAIMTFLAALFTGAAFMVDSATQQWQGDINREVTIQLHPRQNRQLDQDVNTAIGIARAIPGIASVRALTMEENTAMLEPWLETGGLFEELPIPRLIEVRLSGANEEELQLLANRLNDALPNAILDDHRSWIEQLRAISDTMTWSSFGIVLLVLGATILSVVFATQGAMSENRATIEVMHLVGAKDTYLAQQFSRQFMLMGLKGALIGAVSALMLFLIIQLFNTLFSLDYQSAQAFLIFGDVTLSLNGYIAILSLSLIMGIITAFTCRKTVLASLSRME